MKRLTTKELLAESFLELAEKKRIDRITISQITANCGLSQPTFYHHFKDKYDLIVWVYVRDVQQIMDRIDGDGAPWHDSLLTGAQYFAAKRDYVINALRHTSGHDSFLRHVQEVNIGLLVREVRRKLMTERIPDLIMGQIKVYVYGTVQLMVEWLQSDMPVPAEEMAEICEKSLPEALQFYLDNP